MRAYWQAFVRLFARWKPHNGRFVPAPFSATFMQEALRNDVTAEVWRRLRSETSRTRNSSAPVLVEVTRAIFQGNNNN